MLRIVAGAIEAVSLVLRSVTLQVYGLEEEVDRLEGTIGSVFVDTELFATNPRIVATGIVTVDADIGSVFIVVVGVSMKPIGVASVIAGVFMTIAVVLIDLGSVA
jgi:hypothetical protein